MKKQQRTLAEMIEAMKAKIRTQSDDMILTCLNELGGGFLADADKRTVRGYLIEVYCERHGEEAGDLLMDALGM